MAKKKYEKPFHIEMSFSEASERLSNVRKDEMAGSQSVKARDTKQKPKKPDEEK